MDLQGVIVTLLGILSAAASALAVLSGAYASRQKNTITILTQSNDALIQQNTLLKSQLDSTIQSNAKEIQGLQERVAVLERIKTPPMRPLMDMVAKNHTEVMTALGKGVK